MVLLSLWFAVGILTVNVTAATGSEVTGSPGSSFAKVCRSGAGVQLGDSTKDRLRGSFHVPPGIGLQSQEEKAERPRVLAWDSRAEEPG
ncbi:uncharacterized protein LOC109931400 isoform X3 [Rhincodon typus]|uniref:uncharacterized protein LOC109931400 isoform X3 n=1 Tax=Rhincodon typus TaxID=259920 RepID=UPI00202F1693|nr:uncharacterized protein LOC109931400 isoform X3 [Rhincodon typus]